jgi:hypothetical protein
MSSGLKISDRMHRHFALNSSESVKSSFICVVGKGLEGTFLLYNVRGED